MHAVIRFRPLLISLAIPLCLGAATALLAGNTPEAYYSLNLPRFAPPAAVFGIVWNILYVLMGLSSYLIATQNNISRSDRRCALTLYGFALFANSLWSFLFFSYHLFTVAAWWIVIIFAVKALCAALFYRIRPPAGLLLAPTLAWLVFVGALNFAIACCN